MAALACHYLGLRKDCDRYLASALALAPLDADTALSAAQAQRVIARTTRSSSAAARWAQAVRIVYVASRERAREEVAMFANLGKVIYWVAYAVALLMFGLATLVWFTERQSGDLGLIGNLVLIGMTALVIGVGCRYVLARAVGRP